MHDVKNILNAFGDKLQDVNERVKDIGHKDINGAQTMVEPLVISTALNVLYG
jgi:hypothetical protein